MSGFIDYLPEVFASFGPIHTRKMFGGWGLYHDGLMFGLVAGDTLYLKADAESVRFFEEEGLEPFEYASDGRTVKLSYRRAPDAIFDDRDLATLWAGRAFAAARRAQARRTRPARKPKKKKS